MTNQLVGDVYEKIIEHVVSKSRTDFEEFGVIAGTLEELQQEWQQKLSTRGMAHMPWDKKQEPPPMASAAPSNLTNGLPPSSYSNYDTPPSNVVSNTPRVKQESGAENQYGGLPNGYTGAQPQGGAARAAQLMQQQYGNAASASVNAMQRGGLALPPQQQAKPQGLQLPGQSPPLSQQQYSRQHQAQPRIKVENESPHLLQGSFPQQTAQPNYGQTDGADDGLEQWQTMLTKRRALHAQHGQHADQMMRDQVLSKSAELQSGLMVPFDELPSNKRLKRTATSAMGRATSSSPSIPQLDGLVDEDQDQKPDFKDEDDENAINSDLDDSDDDGKGMMGDEDDDNIDSILCTYEKVQRVKNKWKCTLKDGIMSSNGKEWLFTKGMGEFEW